MAELSLADRIAAVLDHLGIDRAHIVTQMPADIADFVTEHRRRIGRVGLIAPPRVEPQAFQSFGGDLLYVAPEVGMLAKTAASAAPSLPDAAHVSLEGYSAESWSDIARDRPDVAETIIRHLVDGSLVDTAEGDETSGKVAGVRYRALGHGPVLVLTPMAFAPSQWEPLLPMLAENFRVVVLSGKPFGMLALLEQRAALQDWRMMCRSIFEALDLAPGDRVLDVGCGSGAIAQQFIGDTSGQNPLTAVDLSSYFLGEAQLSAREAGVNGVDFMEASAEALPFEDNAFDAAYSITVLEECNAAKALSELVRVVKPGGRVGVVVRAIDLPQWWNLPLDDTVRAKIAMPAPSIGDGGVASAALYQMAIEARLKPLRQFTHSVASESEEGPIFTFPEMYALSKLTSEEQALFRAAKADALKADTLFMTRMHHCFVGVVG